MSLIAVKLIMNQPRVFNFHMRPQISVNLWRGLTIRSFCSYGLQHIMLIPTLVIRHRRSATFKVRGFAVRVRVNL